MANRHENIIYQIQCIRIHFKLPHYECLGFSDKVVCTISLFIFQLLYPPNSVTTKREHDRSPGMFPMADDGRYLRFLLSYHPEAQKQH